jgi:hypothetical protein
MEAGSAERSMLQGEDNAPLPLSACLPKVVCQRRYHAECRETARRGWRRRVGVREKDNEIACGCGLLRAGSWAVEMAGDFGVSEEARRFAMLRRRRGYVRVGKEVCR